MIFAFAEKIRNSAKSSFERRWRADNYIPSVRRNGHCETRDNDSLQTRLQQGGSALLAGTKDFKDFKDLFPKLM
jgi:hypothetical protein